MLLKECGDKLTREGHAPFTRQRLIECVQSQHPNKKESSLNPIIQGMTVNLEGGAPGGLGKTVFYSVDRGLFELFDPARHGYKPLRLLLWGFFGVAARSDRLGSARGSGWSVLRS